VRVALPSGHTAEFRDKFLRGDRREAEKGIVVVISPDGSRRMEGSVASMITGRIIRQMLVGWSFEPGAYPLPSQCSTQDLAEGVLDKLDDDDYDAMAKAVGPWAEKVLQVDRGTVLTHGPTGIKVQPVNPADGDKLASLPDFTRDEVPDPKTGSESTAITSSASPAPPGPILPEPMPPTLT
jgi:hypothetical protein